MNCDRCGAEECHPSALFDYNCFLCFACGNDFQEFKHEHASFIRMDQLEADEKVILACSRVADRNDMNNLSFNLSHNLIEQAALEKSFYYISKAWVQEKVKRDNS